MYKKRARQLNAQLLRLLSTKSATAILGQDRDTVEAMLTEQGYLKRLEELLNTEHRLTCANVLAHCQDTLNRLSPAPEEGWLSGAYRYACAVMFPSEDSEELRRSYARGAFFFLTLLQVLFDDERTRFPLDPFLDIQLLPEAELEGSHYQDCYLRFSRAYRREFVYEMMRLGLEATPFRTLEHIAGVHFVAMSAARDLHRASFPVDLALVSGSSIGHDIGKFGCRPGERVPYLHYYYTDQWFKRHRIPHIGHIAANHSVWDLELENLSVESLLLIYADFRVKQERGADGKEVTHLYTLAEAFDVILSKLDNVDEAKRTRYQFVYAKLQDFENYMVSLGVDVTLQGRVLPPLPQPDVALMDAPQVISAMKSEGVAHNLQLMHRLSDQRSFASIMEEARGETNWMRLRAYLSIFSTYSVYLNTAQKEQMLSFLYDQLMHKEGDIRRQAAELMGDILAHFHAGYTKEVPAHHTPDPREHTAAGLAEWYLHRILYPDHKLLPQHKRWINYTLKRVIATLVGHSQGVEQRSFLSLCLELYSVSEKLDDTTVFTLLDTATSLPLDLCTPQQRHVLEHFAIVYSRRRSLAVRAAALEMLEVLLSHSENAQALVQTISSMAVKDSRSLCVIRERILLRQQGLHQDDAVGSLEDEDISEIFLQNLKAATPWIVKKINIRILTAFARMDHGYHLLHIATHLSNLLMVSEQVTVRRSAGAALLELAPLLSHDQRNEVSVELTRGLELGQQEFSKYIPAYLGRFYLYLPPEQLEESLHDLQNALASSNSRLASAALDTVGVLYAHYEPYRQRFPEADAVFRDRRERLLGMMMKGLAATSSSVRQEALRVLGDSVFGSEVLSSHEKRRAFSLAAQKILFLMREDSSGDLTFYYRAAALGHIYRFVKEQELTHGGFKFQSREKVAFFPGTFDPFTLSHKGIVSAIRDLGFEVMLSIDEFSWSKKTQPHRIRRRIASISTADLFHVHIFPEDFPVNIANPENLRRLRQAFPEKEVFIVVGSDVVKNASSYRAAPQPDSIHTFPHIIFRRASGNSSGGRVDYSAIAGRIIELSLPTHLEDISSTRIREAVDLNRDISNLVDPVAQEYIYHHNLYLREPQNKPVFQTAGLFFQVDAGMNGDLARYFHQHLPDSKELPGELLQWMERQGDMILTLQRSKKPSVLGFVSMRCLDTRELFSRLGSAALSDYIRQNAGGRILAISCIFAPRGPRQSDICQLLLTEALTYALRREHTYAFYAAPDNTCPGYVREALSLQGFLPVKMDGREILAVDMRNPIVLTRNMATIVKPPLLNNPRIQEALAVAHRRLQQALTGLYPGNLVLSLSTEILHHRLVEKITSCNGVPLTPVVPRTLGENLCVPFGKILRGVVIPNTVTKALHTDKVYEPDLSSFSIETFPGYASLENQAKTIRAFGQPVILVDDMLHDGKRIRRIAPLLQQEQVPIRQVLVGYLTGMGRDIMAQMEIPVDSVYDLPNLRLKFTESTLYPFIGGDTVRRRAPMVGGLRPSVTRILPYAAPDYTEDCADGSTYHLSLCCLNNARDILLALESEYRTLYARNLTLNRLSEAVLLPMCPDKGVCMTYDLNRVASSYLENDIEMLQRMKSSVRIVI